MKPIRNPNPDKLLLWDLFISSIARKMGGDKGPVISPCRTASFPNGAGFNDPSSLCAFVATETGVVAAELGFPAQRRRRR